MANRVMREESTLESTETRLAGREGESRSRRVVKFVSAHRLMIGVLVSALVTSRSPI